MEFKIPGYSMFSGRDDAAQRIYRRIDCKRGVYLVACEEACADHIYFHDPKDLKSDGFGGATLEFKLEDGSIYSAKGPWKCSANYLLADAGVDLTDKYTTFLVIGRGMRVEPSKSWQSDIWITDVVYQDEKQVIGRFDRQKEVLGTLQVGKYQYFMETNGGTMRGPIESFDAHEFVEPPWSGLKEPYVACATCKIERRKHVAPLVR